MKLKENGPRVEKSKPKNPYYNNEGSADQKDIERYAKNIFYGGNLPSFLDSIKYQYIE